MNDQHDQQKFLDRNIQNQRNEVDVSLFIASNQLALESALHQVIIEACQSSIVSRGVFCIALSGGSVASFLSTLHQSFQQRSIEPHFNRWHICLADERLVPSNDTDSNLLSIQTVVNGWSSSGIQVYGIDETLLAKEEDAAIASSYEKNVLKPLLAKANGTLDCIVLGFGPDGHTCSLFPNHPSINPKQTAGEQQHPLVIALRDSPKPPPRRITLTFPVINSSKCIIICGAGASKKDVVRRCFQQPISVAPTSYSNFSTADNESSNAASFFGKARLLDPPVYPCAMVRPLMSGVLSWILDSEAAQDLTISRL